MDFKLNIGTLTTTINEYYKLANILAEQMGNIDNGVTELTEAGWSGEARDKFIELHKKKQALFAELKEELEYMKNALENEEKPKAVQLKMRSEDFVNCIKRTGNGGALTSNDEGVIILQGNQFSINNNISNCTSSCYPAMQSRFQEIMQLVNGLEYTSFGISGDVWNGETSIGNQTTSLTEFQDSFNIYCNDVQNMESNICSVLSKISGIGDITKFESSSVISESGEIDKDKVKELMLKNQDDLTDEEKEIIEYAKSIKYIRNYKLFVNGYYDREAAVEYATNPKYSSPDKNDPMFPDWLEDSISFLDWNKHTRKYNNTEYERYDDYDYYAKGHGSGSDCANFISQVLNAGGVKQTKDWNFRWDKDYGAYGTVSRTPDATTSWIRPKEQLDYLKNNGYIKDDIITINSVDDMKNAVENDGIQKGDVMFLQNDKEGLHHSMIVTDIKKDGTIEYSAHSNDRINEPVTKDTLDGDTIIIARMKN